MKLSQTILLLIGVLVWYMSSIMVNVHWKSTFKSYGLTKSSTIQHYEYAVFFTTVQFGTGALASFILIVCSGKFENLTSIVTWWRKGIIIGSLFYLGQLSTNMSLTMTSVTLTHMVKTLEPLLALLWALTILKNNISCASVIHMQIMLIGVLLTGYSEVSFNILGVIFAIVSNFALSLRNLFIKLSNHNEIFNGLQLFFLSCLFGVFYSSSLYLLINQSLLQHNYNLFSVESMKMGMYFSGQHMISYLLLYFISITSHALMNCVKRGLIIFISAIVLEVKLPTTQIFGIVITIIGSILYVIESKKPLKDKEESKLSLNWNDMIAQTNAYNFSKSYKLLLLLPMTLLLSITVTGMNQYNIRSLASLATINERSIKEPVTVIWAFDAPLNLRSLELINTNLDSTISNLNIHCSNVEKCKNSVKNSNIIFADIQIIQLKAFELTASTPFVSWMRSHPINKIKSLSCFPTYFHKIMYLSYLWKNGGIVIDMALNVLEKSVTKDFKISTTVVGCLLDQSSSSFVICNLPPKHKYTEVLIGEISKSFLKDPKSCKFVISLENLKNITNITTSGIHYKIPAAETKFGLLGYGATHNLGDEMQSIAAAYILPHIYTFMNRQSFTNPNKINLTYIGNAWWDAGGILFKDIPKLRTVPVAIHISPGAYGKIKSSKHLLTAMAPIGARDVTTYEVLIKHGIESIFTGCLTLWMTNPILFNNHKRNNQTIVVDSVWKTNPLPKNLTNIKYMSHGWGGSQNPQVSHYSMEEKFITTYEFLMQYSQAKVVVTSRIHVALPCVAIGTPVIFYNSRQIWDAGKNHIPLRVVGLLDLFHTVDLFKMNETSAISWLENFDWDNPPANPNPKKMEALKKESRRFLERIPELAVSLKVLGLVS